jgi:hypothetical protein
MFSTFSPKRHVELEYKPLKIKTEDLEISLRDGLVTPLSADCDYRPPPSNTSWAFMPQSSTMSHPSSTTTSFSQGPCTPPNHGTSQTMNSEAKNTQFIYNTNHDGDSSPGFGSTLQKGWNLPRPNISESRMIPMGFHPTVPESSHLMMAVTFGNPNMSTEVTHMPNLTRSWSATAIPALSWSSPAHPSTCGENVLTHLRHQEPWGILDPHTPTDSATIMPSQTMVDMPILASSPLGDVDLSSPGDSAAWDNTAYSRREVYHDGDYSPSEYSSYSLEYPQFKKRGRRPAYRQRGTSGGRVIVELQKRCDELRESGVEVQVTSPHASHVCDWPGCGRKFRRIEHLRRHKEIHLSTGPDSVCPDPACNRSFKSRQDNLRAHFKTHLRQTPGGRCKNPRSFEEFYGFIRDAPDISPDTALKMIAKLEEWRAEDGHHKPESGTTGKGR